MLVNGANISICAVYKCFAAPTFLYFAITFPQRNTMSEGEEKMLEAMNQMLYELRGIKHEQRENKKLQEKAVELLDFLHQYFKNEEAIVEDEQAEVLLRLERVEAALAKANILLTA
jgi:hypothetical protein